MYSPLHSSSFDEPEEDLYPQTPRPESRKADKEINNTNNNKDIKNPYASRGLDKFSQLLADLEKKKKKIYSQKDAEKISSVRFAYSSSNDVVPIVIKSKSKDNKNKEEKVVSIREIIKQDHHKPITTESKDDRKIEGKLSISQQEIKHDHKKPIAAKSQDIKKNEKKLIVQQEIEQEYKPRRPISVTTSEKIKKSEEIKKPASLETEKMNSSPPWEIYLENLRQPCYYGLVVIVLILVLLTFVGRSMAILLISLGWYMVPIVTGPTTTVKPRKKKRRELSRLDENKIASDGFTKEEMEMNRFSDHGLLAAPRLKIDSPRHRVHRDSR